MTQPGRPFIPGVLVLVLLAALLSACGPAPAPTPTTPARPAASGQPSPAPAATAAAPAAPTSPPAAAAKAPTPAPATVKVGLQTTTSSGGVFVALAKGYFKEQNLNVDVEIFRAANDILTQVAAGQIQFGSSSMGPASFNAYEQKLDIKIIGPMHAHPTNDRTSNTLVVRKALYDGGQLRTLADLKGKKVAIPGPGSALQFLLNEHLKEIGLSTRDLDLVELSFPDMPAALGNGSVDAALITEPYATKTEDDGVGFRLLPRMGPGALVTALFINTKYLQTQPDVADRFMVAYLKAARDLWGNGWGKPENVEILAKDTGLSADIIRRSAWPSIDPDGKVELDSVARQQQYYMENGYLRYPQPLDVKAFVDPRPAENAVKSLGAFSGR